MVFILRIKPEQKIVKKLISEIIRDPDYDGNVFVYFHHNTQQYMWGTPGEYKGQVDDFIVDDYKHEKAFGDVYECSNRKFKIVYHSFIKNYTDEPSDNAMRMGMVFSYKIVHGDFVYVELIEIGNRKYMKYQERYNTKCNFNSCFATGCLNRCSKCKSARYCGKEHQTADWKLHKKTCAPN